MGEGGLPLDDATSFSCSVNPVAPPAFLHASPVPARVQILVSFSPPLSTAEKLCPCCSSSSILSVDQIPPTFSPNLPLRYWVRSRSFSSDIGSGAGASPPIALRVGPGGRSSGAPVAAAHPDCGSESACFSAADAPAVDPAPATWKPLALNLLLVPQHVGLAGGYCSSHSKNLGNTGRMRHSANSLVLGNVWWRPVNKISP